MTLHSSSEVPWRALVEGAPFTLLILGPHANIVWASGDLPGVFGDPTGKDLGHLLVDTDADAIRRRIQRVQETSRPERFTARVVTDVVLSITLAPLSNHDGQDSQVIAVVDDITARVRAQAKLARSLAYNDQVEREAQQIEQQESLAKLAGGLAHDFNNLLGAILANAHFVREEVRADQDLVEPLDELIEAVDRAGLLCNQLMAYAGQGKVRVTRVDLGSVLDAMRDELRHALPDRSWLGITVDPSAEIQGDANQVRQIIRALVDNAGQALLGRAGTVHVRCRIVEVDGLLPHQREDDVPVTGTNTLIEVEDDGQGMPAAVLDRVFEPFFTARKGGRGLGLAAVMGIVRAHGGTVAAESVTGQGSTFRVWLPHADASPQRRNVWPPANKRTGTTILVVDDEVVMRTVCGRVLQRAGYDCLFASNGRQAIEIFSEQVTKVGLVLLDLSMPHVDGNEALCLIREIDPHVPVIMMSGWTAEDPLVDPVHGAGASDFLHKPFPPQALLGRVRQLLSQ